ncbi:MAG: diaminopimelate epimerase, partial [Mycobacterium sp.]|nr:diaminopimelate epimerase [Mycobacterium sp.]
DIEVTVTDATSFLRGPSMLVARGEISGEWWNAQQR